MTTVFTVVGVTKLIYEVLERDYGVPNPTTGGGGSLGTGAGGLSQAQVQELIDTAIAGLPQAAGVTLAQVEASIAAAIASIPAGAAGLSAEQVQEIVDAAVAAIPPGTTDEAAVVAIIEAKLTDFAPMIQQAIQSQFNAMPDRIRLNTTGANATIEVLNLTANPTTGGQNVSALDIEAEALTVNGKRVLTVDDALEAAGGSVEQAAVEAVVAAATAPLLERIAELELQQAQQQNTIGNIRQEITEVVQFTLDTYPTKVTFQQLMDAINGPSASPDSIMHMFWLLNDIVMALVDATGIEIEGAK